ncbi:MAG TPA: hypothetical protein ENK75_01600, partial [Saprospiraceae bacterium]|nr:hypothetical protein [Saprospiraceae bacterium]
QNRQIRISHYNGLPANEINALTSLDNTIWAATSKGLIKFSKDIINQPKPPTDIHINKIEINNSPTPLSNKAVNFTSSQNNLKITLDAINYSLRGDLQFKYRLLPDTQWQTTQSPTVSFTNLKPEKYKFDVLLKNDELVGTHPSFSFRINKPWWQKSWVQFIFVGLAILGTYLIVTFFQKNKFRKIKKDKEIQEKIAMLKITALQAQMNPHFIFNTLNTIQSFIYDNRQDLATKTLGNFSKLIRKVFKYSNYKVISLDHEIDFLKTYIDLEKLRFDQYLTVQLTCSDYVQSHSFALSIPPLLVQPIIENAFAHGLLHQDGEKKLNIHFEVIDKFLKCSVIDNGIGIEQSAKFNLETNQKRNISGLQLTEDRIRVFNRAVNTQSEQKSFIITDLERATNGRESGTKVEIFIAIDHGE